MPREWIRAYFPAMRAFIPGFNRSVNHWVRGRLAFPLLVVLTAAILFVSENTYDETTSTLRGGISLTESRVKSARLLQLLTDAETAEYGFLLTGKDDFLTRFTQAQMELPAVQLVVTNFLASQGAEGANSARYVDEFTDRKFAQVSRTLELARAGDVAAGNQLARDAKTLTEIRDLRQALNVQLDKATAMQQAARVSIYDALLVNRVVVGSLALIAFLSLLMLLRQLRRQDRERIGERERLEVEVQRRTVRLTELARHLQSVREDERANVARELHDELGAVLTVSKLEIARARNRSDQPGEIMASLDRVIQALDKGIALKRRIIEDLTPSSLTHLGLKIALENLCNDMSVSLAIPVHLSITHFQLTREAELAVYRFVQEALTNIGKYAAATQVTVTLTSQAGHAAVEVQDDGIGFDALALRAGRHGLSGMQFRAESLGGSMSVLSIPGEGSTLRIEFPQSP